jgi:hypothetical protein
MRAVRPTATGSIARAIAGLALVVSMPARAVRWLAI